MSWPQLFRDEQVCTLQSLASAIQAAWEVCGSSAWPQQQCMRPLASEWPGHVAENAESKAVHLQVRWQRRSNEFTHGLGEASIATSHDSHWRLYHPPVALLAGARGQPARDLCKSVGIPKYPAPVPQPAKPRQAAASMISTAACSCRSRHSTMPTHYTEGQTEVAENVAPPAI